jgi:hypothetical protein
MEKETPHEKSLRLLQKYFDETPREEIDAELARIDAMHIEGPTIDEYFDGLQKHLAKWQETIGG